MSKTTMLRAAILTLRPKSTQDTSTEVAPLLRIGRGLGVWIAVLMLCCSAADSNSPAVVQAPPEVYAREVVGYLAGPECAGRRTGEPGAEQAARYIESQFAILGVEPLAGAAVAGYRQEFPVTRGIRPAGMPQAAFHETELKLNQDYALAPFCGSGSFTDEEVVFVGYGISAPELGWDDYAGLDASGKVVVIVRGEPQSADPSSKFSGDQPTVHSDLRRKAAAAKAHGALAMLVLENPLTNAPAPDELPEQRPAWGGSSSDLPVLHVKRVFLEQSIQMAHGHALTDILHAMDSHGMPASVALGTTFSLELTVEKDQLPAWNIVGVLPGSGELASQYVVIGAHYDHLGEGGPESLAPSEFGHTHWGADDNASGVAAVLGIARVLLQTASRGLPRRSVLLVLFSGEEIGLVGSNWFVEHPAVPLDDIYAMLNFDMVGRLREGKLTLGGTGTAQEFQRWLDESDQTGLHVISEETGMGGSDHMSFIAKGIPSLFFFTGTHPDYHTPGDTADKVNYPGLVQVAAYGAALAQTAAFEPAALTFVKPEMPSGPSRNRAGLSVTMGTVPSYSEGESGGFVLADVVPGGPAAVAGLRGGDVITQIGEVKVANIYDFMYSLQGKQPGETVEVTVLRSGSELKFSVTLAARGVEQ